MKSKQQSFAQLHTGDARGKSLVSIAPRLAQYAASVRALRNVTGQCKTLTKAFTISLQIEPLIPASAVIDVRCWSGHTAALSRVRKGCQQPDCEWRFITGDVGYLGRPTQVDEGPLATGGNANSRERSRSDRHHYGAQQLRCAALLGRSGLHLACVCRLREAASHNVSSCSKRPRLWNFNFAEVACRIAQPQEPLP